MPNSIIIDVGAGMWKSYDKYLGPNKCFTIISFEPHPESYNKLVTIKDKLDKNVTDNLMIFNTAISNRTKSNVKFYMLNDPVASSLYPLNKQGVAKWKYPFNRKRFALKSTITVDTITLDDFLRKYPRLKKYTIDLLNVDAQGNCMDILDGISPLLFKKIKRIIVKCIETPFELYKNQSDMVDVIDKLRVHDFTVIRSSNYSREQEQIIEFVNTTFMPTQSDMNPMFNISPAGKLSINIE